jgi:hypothetical protein
MCGFVKQHRGQNGQHITRETQDGLSGLDAANQKKNQQQNEGEMQVYPRTKDMERAETAGCADA